MAYCSVNISWFVISKAPAGSYVVNRDIFSIKDMRVLRSSVSERDWNLGEFRSVKRERELTKIGDWRKERGSSSERREAGFLLLRWEGRSWVPPWKLFPYRPENSLLRERLTLLRTWWTLQSSYCIPLTNYQFHKRRKIVFRKERRFWFEADPFFLCLYE